MARVAAVRGKCKERGCVDRVYIIKWGMCCRHYMRARHRGETGAPPRRRCKVALCTGYDGGKGLCPKHRERLKRLGSLDLPEKKPRQLTARWLTGGGYVAVYRPGHPNCFDSRRGVALEHRAVMADSIGRPLFSEETVHHMNGDRADNRLCNLELWSSRNPPGQRVADKIRFAVEILQLYAPERLAWHSGRRKSTA